MRRWFVVRVRHGLGRRREPLAQGFEFGLERALPLLLQHELVAERLQRALDVRDPDFEFGQ